jgi:AraC-like DNA-binding protein
MSAREQAKPPSASPVRRLPRGLFILLRDSGVDLTAVATAAGIDPARLERPEVSLTTFELGTFLDQVYLASGDPAIGLRIGEHARPELVGVVGLSMLSAATFGDALARCARYKRVMLELVVEIIPSRERTIVRLDTLPSTRPVLRWRIDAELAFMASFGRRFTERPIAPLEVRLRGAPPPYRAEYERIVGAAVRFGHNADELWLPPRALEVPMVTAAPEAHALLVTSAERQLVEATGALPERVSAAVEALLPDGPPSIAQVARRLGTSARSLQRGLHQERTSFSEVVDDTRKARAARLLEELDAVEVSFLVGFSHPNSFYRAFRRWTGMSPLAYRAARSSASSTEARRSASRPTHDEGHGTT